MKPLIKTPINACQHVFNELCELGGGRGGGPAPGKVRDALRTAGQRLNDMAYREVAAHFAACPGANPWHICFAIGLSWGHLAKLDTGFTQAVVSLLDAWNPADLKDTKGYALERGPMVIENSLIGARTMFSLVRLPAQLPSSLAGLDRAQNRWLGPLLGPNRPRHIGSWNATAMFMAALFAQPNLASTHTEPRPVLPPGGPISKGLALLHQAEILSRGPSGNDLDDGGFEPGVIYENNALLAEVHNMGSNWSLIDVHSGVYMLGTRHLQSGSWA